MIQIYFNPFNAMQCGCVAINLNKVAVGSLKDKSLRIDTNWLSVPENERNFHKKRHRSQRRKQDN